MTPWGHIAIAAGLVATVACVNPQPRMYYPDIVAIVDTDSDKVVQVVSDERMAEHEPRAVPGSSVAAALIASGMFLDDDARLLADPIANRLATMQTDEAVRSVGWAADAPRYYYVLVHNHRLQIIYYAGATQSDSYSAALPTEAVAIKTPEAKPPEPSVAPVAPVSPAPPPDAGVDLVAKGPPPAKPVHRAHPRPAGLEPITEAQARRRMKELDEAVASGLITEAEHKQRRKEILARL